MAGQYVTIINPGYSHLWVKDLPYSPGSGESASINPFDPTEARALIEGEFLQRVGSGAAARFTRGGDNVVTVPGTPDGEGTVPAFIYFQEKGRYDAQASKHAHCIVGPSLFEFRTKLCRSAGLSLNDRVSVWDLDNVGPQVRRGLAAFSAGWSVGRVSRIYGTDDIAVIFGLH